jgi:hypothetical protein
MLPTCAILGFKLSLPDVQVKKIFGIIINIIF